MSDENDLIEPLNLDVIEYVYSPDTVFPPVWYPFPRLEGIIGEELTFDYRDYIFNADEFLVREGSSSFLASNGVITYMPSVNGVVEHTVRAINSKTRTFEDQTLIIDVQLRIKIKKPLQIKCK